MMKWPLTFPYGAQHERCPEAGGHALAVAAVTLTYTGAERPALDGVSLTMERGEKVALIGPNGAGKSTLIKVVAGQMRPERGTVRVFGNPVGACPHRTAYLPQRGEVNWRFPVTVEQVVMMGRYPHLGWFKRPGAVDREAVAQALGALNLSHLAERQVGQLSGGQQQRVMLARALAQEADLLLLDEPLNNVDVRTQAMIFDILDRLAMQGKAVLVSTHDLGTLHQEFHRAIFLDHTIVADGSAAEILKPELLARAYGIAPHVCPPELLMPARER